MIHDLLFAAVILAGVVLLLIAALKTPPHTGHHVRPPGTWREAHKPPQIHHAAPRPAKTNLPAINAPRHA